MQNGIDSANVNTIQLNEVNCNGNAQHVQTDVPQNSSTTVPDVLEMEELDIASSGVVIETAVGRQTPASYVCHPKHLDSLTTLTSVASMSYAGVSLRMGIIAYFQFVQPESSMYAVVWANFLGCFIMGLLTDHKAALAKFYSPLAVALLTGFCGSLTSFSNVMVSGPSMTFGLSLCKSHAHERTLSFLENYFFNFVVSFTIFLYGRQISHKGCTERTARSLLSTQDRPHHTVTLLFALNIIFYLTLTIIWIMLSIYFPTSRGFSIAMLFGQFGAILRYYIGKHFNPYRPYFPIGTFIVNVAGSAIAAVAFSAPLYLGAKIDSLSAIFLSAISNGFCGALSTVSTFIAEIALLPDLAASSRYSLLSLCCAQVLAFVPYICFYYLANSEKPMYC